MIQLNHDLRETARLALEIDAAQETAETRSCGAEWHPVTQIYNEISFDAVRERVDRLTPSNQTLLKLAERQPPPQSWFDADDDPFTE